jgi:NAD(P)-dependent dehydrogenase (short-subunit alcohol dehydrogenase family)
MSVEGHVCVVTGASSGIGQAIAVAFARAGAEVWALGRSRERLNSVVTDAEGLAGSLTAVVADLEHEEEIRSAGDAILSQSDAVDVLVHCAGAISRGPVESADVEDFDRQYRVNLRAPFLLTRALLPALRRSSGQIVFINSSAGAAPAPDAALYAATKHGLKGFADSLRQEVNTHGIRVLTVYPGRVATPMQKSVHEHEGRQFVPDLLMPPDDVAELVLAVSAFARTTEVTEVKMGPQKKLPEARQ